MGDPLEAAVSGEPAPRVQLLARAVYALRTLAWHRAHIPSDDLKITIQVRTERERIELDMAIRHDFHDRDALRYHVEAEPTAFAYLEQGVEVRLVTAPITGCEEKG